MMGRGLVWGLQPLTFATSMSFPTATLINTLFLVPFPTKTMHPKPKLAHMHHYCSLI